MIKLVSIQMRNFGTVSDSKIDFPDSGLVLVTGINRTGTGQFSSIGSGKTLLGEAICRTLFGVPGRYTKFSGYSKGGEGNTYVALTVLIDGKKLLIEIGYKCKELSRTGEGLRFTLEGSDPVMYGNIKDTRSELSRIVGMQHDVASWTVYVDGDDLDFSSLSESRGVGLLMGVLGCPSWSDYYAKAVAAHKSIGTDLDKTRGSFDTLTSGLNQAKRDHAAAVENLARATADYNQKEADRSVRCAERNSKIGLLEARLSELSDMASGLKTDLTRAEKEEALAYSQAESVRLAATSEYQKLSRSLKSAQSAVTAAEIALDEAKEALTKAELEAQSKAYSRYNKERSDAIARENRAKHEYAQALFEWNKQVRDLENLSSKLRTEKGTLLEFIGINQKSLDIEQSRTNVCPYAGCGKTIPLDNAKTIADLKQAIATRNQRLSQVEESLASSSSKLDELKSNRPQEYVETPVPDEKKIVDLRQEQEWIDICQEIETKVQLLSSEREKLASSVSAISSSVELALAAKAEADDKVAAVTAASTYRKIAEKLQAIEKERSGLESSKSNLNLEQVKDVVSDSAVVAAQSAVDILEKSVLEKEESLAKVNTDLSDFYTLHKVIDYWKNAFSPTGIPNMLLEEAVPKLNLVAQKVCSRMTGGVLDLVFGTTRETASGNNQSELTVRVNNNYGSNSAEGSSKGEGGLVDLIISETLSEVGRTLGRIKVKWYDEVTGGHDVSVRRTMFSFMREMAAEHKALVFVVDHSAEVAAYADKVLVAEKGPEGSTTYYWQS